MNLPGDSAGCFFPTPRDAGLVMGMTIVTPSIRIGKIWFFSTNISTATPDAAAVQTIRPGGQESLPGYSARILRAVNPARFSVNGFRFSVLGSIGGARWFKGQQTQAFACNSSCVLARHYPVADGKLKTGNRKPLTVNRKTAKALKALYLFSAIHQWWLSRSTRVFDVAGPQLPDM
jgi:hypothetical protein